MYSDDDDDDDFHFNTNTFLSTLSSSSPLSKNINTSQSTKSTTTTTNNNNNNAKSTTTITCFNCGSTNFYRDDNTDSLICNTCYTYSQSQSQRETTDHEEVMAVAATSRGRMTTTKRSSSGGNGRSGRRKFDYELDESISLPNVCEFCIAFQILLQCATEKLADIASPIGIDIDDIDNDVVDNHNDDHNDNKDEKSKRKQILQSKFKSILLSKVQSIWFNYLTTWNEAATFYSKLYPELRILSFRDYFLPQPIKIQLYRYLSSKAIKILNDVIEESSDNYNNDDINNENDINNDDGNNENEKYQSMKYHEIMNEGYNQNNISQTDHNNNRNKMNNEKETKRRKRKRVVTWQDQLLDGSQIDTENDIDDHRQDSDDEIDHEIDDENDDDENDYSKGIYFRSPVNSIYQLLQRTEGRIDNNTISPRYAVLKLKPNLNLLSSIIYLALLQCHVGISSNHLVSWAYSGLYPFLLNGLQFLPTEIQEKLKQCSCSNAFRQKTLPKPALLDYYSDLLVISLGLDKNEMNSNSNDVFVRMERENKTDKKSFSYSQMNNFPGVKRKLIPSHLNNTGQPTQNTKKKKKVRDSRQSDSIPLGQLTPSESSQQSLDGIPAQNVEHSKFMYYYKENIPLMTYRFVTDLGLHQRVLDLSLALMGFEVSPMAQDKDQEKNYFDINSFIPAPLVNASVDKIASPLHIMAVIVVACKMCFGWQNWKVQLSPHVAFGNSNDIKGKHDDTNSNKDSKSESSNMKKSTSSILHQRFIPWNDDDVNLIGNGKMLNDYFDFIEETYGDELPRSRLSDEILNMMDSTFRQEKKTEKLNQIDEESTIIPNLTIAGGSNPNMPNKIKAKDHNFHNFLEMRHKGAVWTDANGFGEYIVYKEIGKHAITRRSLVVGGEARISSEPFHPHYSLLIEYISDKLFVEPGELHYLVSCLDEEIIQRNYLLDKDKKLDTYKTNRELLVEMSEIAKKKKIKKTQILEKMRLCR